MFRLRPLLNRFSIPGHANLSLKEIQSILNKDTSIRQTKFGTIHTVSLAANHPNEDSQFVRVTEEKLLMGVIDGHWYNHTSLFLSSKLPDRIIANHSQSTAMSLLETFESMDTELVSAPLELLKKHGCLTVDNVRNLNVQTKLKIIEESIAGFSGACALAVVYDGSHWTVAHAGDCRSILGQKNGDYKPISLTSDHQAGNMIEFDRLIKEHPNETDTVAFRPHRQSPMRVLGGMMPSRAFGDARYKLKLPEQDLIDALVEEAGHCFARPPHLKTPPCIYILIRHDSKARYFNTQSGTERLVSCHCYRWTF
jgi:pyruvate dehydrogenase phosphatase